MRILLLEDEESIRGFIRINLKRNDMDVVEADNGEDAIAHAEEQGPFDIALLDVMLPTISGFEVCEALRERYPRMGIIMLTAKSQEEDKIRGLELGADDYVQKPFSPGELIARIKSLYRRMTVDLPYAVRGEEADRGEALAAETAEHGGATVSVSNTAETVNSGEVAEFVSDTVENVKSWEAVMSASEPVEAVESTRESAESREAEKAAETTETVVPGDAAAVAESKLAAPAQAEPVPSLPAQAEGADGSGQGLIQNQEQPPNFEQPVDTIDVPQSKLVSGAIKLSIRERRLWKGEQEIILTPTEWTLVRLLMEREGESISRDHILNEVWGRYYVGDLKVVDVNIRRIRQKIEASPSNPSIIETVWGYGYRWKRSER